MKLFLTEEKLLRSKLEAERLLKSIPVVKILASFLGFCQSTLPAIAVAPLHFRNLQADIIKALKGSGGTRLPECSLSLSRGQERTGMVEGLLKNEQWQKHFAPGRTRHNILRRFQARIGGTFESSKNKGSMELGGKGKITHKLAGVKSSFPGFASFSSPTKTSACSDWHRQQNSNDLYQQIRGKTFTSSHIALEMWNFAADRNLTLSVLYVPREENQIADKNSRVFQDSLEWMLLQGCFRHYKKKLVVSV